MKVIYKDSIQAKEVDYPRGDISEKVYGLDKSIQYYFINEVKQDNTEPEKYRLIQLQDELTDKNHEIYSHLKVCNRVWVLEEKSQDDVIQRLNELYGAYLDEQYPQIVRLNHLIEVESGTTSERVLYIQTLQSWLIACKVDRENRIKNYLEKNIFPEMDNFIVKP